MSKIIPLSKTLASNASTPPRKLQAAQHIRQELMRLEDEALKAGLIHSAIMIEQAQHSLRREVALSSGGA